MQRDVNILDMVTTNTTQEETKAMPTKDIPVRVVLPPDVIAELERESHRMGIPLRDCARVALVQLYRTVSGDDEILDKTTGN
jgi:hypothetical protein